jgi:hypothetical protein
VPVDETGDVLALMAGRSIEHRNRADPLGRRGTAEKHVRNIFQNCSFRTRRTITAAFSP